MVICERCKKEVEWLNSHSNKNICLDCVAELSEKANSRRIRFIALKRDNFKCKLCGNKGAEVRTINGESENLDNLITLCNDCIRKRENKRNL
jgi:5-methylcytosine-specific restriction endonuclease McrA